MPFIVIALLGGAFGLYLVQSGRVTSRGLVAMTYAFLGGLLGILLLRAAVGTIGPIGALIGAVIGAVVIIWAMRQIGPGSED